MMSWLARIILESETLKAAKERAIFLWKELKVLYKVDFNWIEHWDEFFLMRSK